MATLKEYFDTDFRQVLTTGNTFKFTGEGEVHFVEGRLHSDFDANATFISCFIPATAPTAPTARGIFVNLKPFLALAHASKVQMGLPGERPRYAESLRFSGRVFIYHEQEMETSKEDGLIEEAATLGVVLQLRGPRFAQERSRIERPLAFISHDSKDKDAIARPIALGLSRLMCPVWFDEFSLRVGDRLRETIERGLRETNRCILVLTPNFLSNDGWTKAEFNSVFTRELIEKTDVILPVWHNVSVKDVYNYSPSLADRIAVKWSDGEQSVVRALYRAVVADGPAQQ